MEAADMIEPTHFIVRFLRLLRGRRILMGLTVGFGLAFASTTLIPPLLIRRLITWLTEGGGTHTDLLTISIALVGLYVLRGVCRYGYGRFSHVAAYRVQDDLMIRVYRHMQRLSHRFYSERRTGSLIARSINDVEAIEDFIAHGIPNTVLAIIIPVAMLAVLMAINLPLALIVVAPLPVAAFIIYHISRPIRNMWRQVRSELADLVAQVQDSLAGMVEIKSFRREREQADRLAHRSATFREARIQANSISFLPVGIVEIAGGVGIIIAVWLGGNIALGGRLSVADLFVFVVYLGYIYQPFLQLTNLTDVLNNAASSMERVFYLLDIEPDITNAPDTIAPTDLKWDIAFRGVTFGYRDDLPVLHDIRFKVPEGKLVALVGPTGAGKTTVTRLLQRFYDPQEGCVAIGDYEVRKLDLDFLRRNISAVMQDVFLFHDTVRQNILFGRPDADEAEIRVAAQAANAESFILQLPFGYDTIVGDRGVRLSGGEKQRISIARALLKDAPILILDEATSAVDTETEWLIQQALSRLTYHRTTLVIAHRLSTIRNADQIVVVDEGRIAEIGTHVELLDLDGFYAHMVRRQDLARSWQLDVKEYVIS